METDTITGFFDEAVRDAPGVTVGNMVVGLPEDGDGVCILLELFRCSPPGVVGVGDSRFTICGLVQPQASIIHKTNMIARPVLDSQVIILSAICILSMVYKMYLSGVYIYKPLARRL
jgi:hypothetical protein